MIAFENMVTNRTGTFPNTVAKNASGAGATDGTEYVAPIVSDLWGFWQDILAQATMTPSGVAEVAAATGAAAAGTAQQKRMALEMKFGAPGELVFDCIAPGSGTYGSQSMAWGAAAGGPPARYQYRRVLPMAGQVGVVIANYADLCAAVYCGDANNATATAFYKTSDAGGTTRSTSGTYMTMADFRGVTIRGRDTGNVHDPAGSTRGGFGGQIASLQQDAFQGHIHYLQSGVNLFNSGSTYGGATTNAGSAPPAISSPVTDGTNGTPRTSSETRMYNASCNIGLRY